MGARSESVLIPVLFALAARPAPAQELWHDLPGGHGKVVDERGEPVPGAQVRLVVRHAPDGRHAGARAVLARHPLPRAASNDDGSFFLPLSPDQRMLGDKGRGLFALVVEKNGYARWTEPLAGGLRNWLGSHVTLRRPDPRDRITLRIQDPLPGMLLLVTNSVEPLLAQEHPVPQHGSLTLDLPLLPNPFVPLAPISPVLVRGRLLHPLGATQEFTLAPNPAPVRCAEPRAAVSARHRFARADGSMVTGLRGLYRAPDSRLRWFELAGAEAPENEFCRLVAVTADGCLPTTEWRTGILQPVPEELRLATLLLRDAGGRAVQDARIELYPLVDWPRLPDALAIDARPLARREGGSDGSCRMPWPDEPAFALVQAPGFHPLCICDPRAPDPALLTMHARATGSVIVEFADSGGRPIPGATLLFDQYPATVVERSDVRGRLLLSSVTAGNHSASALAPLHCIETVQCRVTAGEKLQLRVELAPAAALRVQARDAQDQPSAFLPVVVQETRQLGNQGRRVQSQLWADSLGRIHVVDSDVDSELMLLVRNGQVRQQVRAGADPMAWTTPQLRPVLVDPGEQTAWQQYQITTAGGGGMGGSTSPGQAFRFLLLAWVTDWKELTLAPCGGQPMRIDNSLLPPGVGPVRLHLPRSQRRTRLLVLSSAGESVTDFICVDQLQQFVFREVPVDAGMVELSGDETWFVARDLAPRALTILHPDHVPANLSLPQAPAPAEPAFRLQRGSRLELKLPRQFDKGQIRLQIRAADGGGVPIQYLIDVSSGLLRDGSTLVCPAALPSGNFRIEVMAPQLKRWVKQSVAFDGETPVVLTVGEN